ncbi:MAG: hypothetical protein PHP65_01170 [Bacilli bacterium]|nr:hypothetical protein [Bacilli bacterium]
MKKKMKIYFRDNLKYLCEENGLKVKKLKQLLGIKGTIKSLDSFIKICNYFDIVADGILFTHLKDTTMSDII